MSQQRSSSLFGVCLAIAATWLLAALVWSAPAPEDESTPDELAVEPAKATEEQAERNLTASGDNLKKIALAVISHADSNNGLLPRDFTDKDGKALLSWRVAILPFVEQDELYKNFKLNEPWNSENNKKLLEKMPEVFSSPRVAVKKKGFTVYQGFSGPGAMFETGKKMLFPAAIPDGTSNTILAVESSVAVPWSKPADLPFDVKKDLPDIGKAYGARPLRVMCDSSIGTLNLKTLTPETFKAAITRNGGEVLGADW
jgi:hypothetical protein